MANIEKNPAETGKKPVDGAPASPADCHEAMEGANVNMGKLIGARMDVRLAYHALDGEDAAGFQYPVERLDQDIQGAMDRKAALERRLAALAS